MTLMAATLNKLCGAQPIIGHNLCFLDHFSITWKVILTLVCLFVCTQIWKREGMWRKIWFVPEMQANMPFLNIFLTFFSKVTTNEDFRIERFKNHSLQSVIPLQVRAIGSCYLKCRILTSLIPKQFLTFSFKIIIKQ